MQKRRTSGNTDFVFDFVEGARSDARDIEDVLDGSEGTVVISIGDEVARLAFLQSDADQFLFVCLVDVCLLGIRFHTDSAIDQ